MLSSFVQAMNVMYEMFSYSPENFARALARRPLYLLDEDAELPRDFPVIDGSPLPREYGDNAMVLILSTATAYESDAADAVSSALAAACGQNREFLNNLRYALHETLANAIVHGNLGISSNLRVSLARMKEFSDLLGRRLADPEYAARPVMIAAFWDSGRLTVSVRDAGDGFEVKPLEKPNAYRKTGRGFSMISAHSDTMAVEDGGRRIVLTYFLKSESAAAVPEGRELYLGEDGRLMGLEAAAKAAPVRIAVENGEIAGYLEKILSASGFTDVARGREGASGGLLLTDNPALASDCAVYVEGARDEGGEGFADIIALPLAPRDVALAAGGAMRWVVLENFITSALRRLSGELDTARRMQKDLLPTAGDLAGYARQYNLSIGQYFEPSSEIGGDVWAMRPVDERRLAVMLGDFSGHGVSAALNTFRLHTLLAGGFAPTMTSGDILWQLNATLYGLLPRGQFATFVYGVVDTQEHSFTFAGAGAPPPFIIAASGRVYDLDTGGFPLGITKKAKYPTITVDFYPGDTLFLYSDCLVESVMADGQPLGLDGVKRLVFKYSQAGGAEAWVDNLAREFRHGLESSALPDDLTMVMLGRRG
ncbi:hypothetical protein FACS1894186_0510 [Alphaproteobacteria bacterium]|nr:hypothetical protein FACS1894186_0510 [Alphaproteobacteria bacterium]